MVTRTHSSLSSTQTPAPVVSGQPAGWKRHAGCGDPASEAAPVPDGPWFNAIARHLGRAYWAPGTGRVLALTNVMFHGPGQRDRTGWAACRRRRQVRAADHLPCGQSLDGKVSVPT